jgi:hypothetical protein
MTPEKKEELLRKLADQLLAEAGDDAVAAKICSRCEMLEDMNVRGIPDHVQVRTVLKRFPDVNKSSLHELIDGSSDCTYPRNRERLSAFLKRTENS